MFTTKLNLLTTGARSVLIPLGRRKDVKVGTYFRVTRDGDGMDLDLQAFLVGAKREKNEVAFYNRRWAAGFAVRLAPEVSQDEMFALLENHDPALPNVYDETLKIKLEELPDWVDKVVITCSIHYEGDLPAEGHHFGNVKLIEMHVETPSGKTTHAKVSFCGGRVKGRTAAILAEIIRSNGGWLLKLIGTTCNGGLGMLCSKYRVPVD